MPPLYPNMFVLLVATPGIGKSVAINRATQFLRQTKNLKIAPATMTKAAMVDAIKDSHRAVKSQLDGSILEYHSLIIPSPEFGNLVPAWDSAFMNVLNDLFDSRSDFIERTRGGGEIVIENPQINLLAGTQPDYLNMLMPPEAWGTGFASRNILIFSDDKTKKSLFGHHRRPKALNDALAADLKQITELQGEFNWHPSAAAALDEWYLLGGEPVPKIHQLEHYITRRHIHLVKLMMISSLSRNNDLTLERCDFDTALGWLLEAEATMPGIFRAMTMTADAALTYDAALWVQEQEKALGHGLAEHTIVNHLRSRMKTHEVMKAYELMQTCGMLVQSGLDARGKPLYSAPDIDPPTKPRPPARPLMPSPPPSNAPLVPARYILRVSASDEDDLPPPEHYPEDEELNPFYD
jgi:hypothetical protein